MSVAPYNPTTFLPPTYIDCPPSYPVPPRTLAGLTIGPPGRGRDNRLTYMYTYTLPMGDDDGLHMAVKQPDIRASNAEAMKPAVVVMKIMMS